MALSRRSGQRFQGAIWPGFVDAMTGLLLVLMFVLTIFMIVQFVLRETISGQESQLDALSSEVAALASALGLEQRKNDDLTGQVSALSATLSDARTEAEQQAALIAALQNRSAQQAQEIQAANARIVSFEQQVASLLAERDSALENVADLETRQGELLSEKDALNLALASARSEIDNQVEAARLAAAKREALEALISDLRAKNKEADQLNETLSARVEDLTTRLSDEDAARLAEAAAAEALRERLKNANAELTAMTLALEEERKRAEDTLTLLAAAETAQSDLDERLLEALLSNQKLTQGQQQTELTLKDAQTRLAAANQEIERLKGDAGNSTQIINDLRAKLVVAEANGDTETQMKDLRAQFAAALAAKLAAEQSNRDQLSKDEAREVLLANARAQLAEQEAQTTDAQRQTALLNQQVSALRQQLQGLQSLLDDAKDREAAQNVQLQNLGTDLNTALARAAAEEKKRRLLEETERKRLEAEAKDLERYRSEFFGRLRDVLAGRDGVRIEGDRFVFSSEVLFPPGGATLSAGGREQIAGITNLLRDISSDIPAEIDWVIRVDGHTDNLPLSGLGQFKDNWELSQARALSVVRYMSVNLGMPPNRLAANGFGEYQPLNPADTLEARAQNRRIELKLTEK